VSYSDLSKFSMLLGLVLGVSALAVAVMEPSKRPGDPPVEPPTEPPVEPERLPLLRDGDRVVLAGDSLAVGLTGPLGYLLREDGYEFRSVAVGGTNITQWSRPKTTAFKKIVGTDIILESRPTLVLLSLGTNDGAMTEKMLEAEEAALRELIQVILDSGARLVWILPLTSIQVPNLDRARYMIAENMGGRRDGYVYACQVDVPLSPDKIHPTGSGYKLWSADLYRYLITPR